MRNISLIGALAACSSLLLGSGAVPATITPHTGSGNPNGSLSCTQGKDAYTDSTTGYAWWCQTTGTSSTAVWQQIPPIINTNTTYVIAASGGNFTSVQSAVAFLQNVVISPGIFVTLQVNDGTYASSSSVILVSTAFGRSIKIQGQHTYTKSMSSVQSSSGSAGAWSVVVNLNNVTNTTTSDYAIITASTGGSNPSYISGCWPITNVDVVNNRITVSTTHQAAAAPSGAVTATVTIIKSILTFTGSDGIEVWNQSTLNGLSNIVLVGDRAHNGLSVQDVGRLFLGANVGLNNWLNGIDINYNSEVNGDNGNLISNTAGNGIFAYNGGAVDIDGAGSVISGNVADAIQFFIGANIFVTGGVLTGNGGDGIDGYNAGVVSFNGSTITGNQGCGIQSDATTLFAATDISSSTFSGNVVDQCANTTGSGKLVYANSPALVSPNLGTPTALTLTNATGLPTGGLVANAVTSAKTAVVNTRRTCIIDNDTQSATALTAANFSGRCVIPAASTIVEVDVIGGTGTINGSAAAPTVTGASSIQLGKYTPNGGASTTGLLSAALATASGKACALTATSGTCINGNGSSSSVSISTTALAAGDVLYVSAASADAVQTWFNITVIYTIN